MQFRATSNLNDPRGGRSAQSASPQHNVVGVMRTRAGRHMARPGLVDLNLPTVVQQCSDQAELWRTVPACTGRSFPIHAVVGWDGLNPGDDVTPVVPGMDQRADGVFFPPA